ncbi:MAG: hypothetical protein IV100_32735 [Myxococcales bacterium]|nr:hypothetical protein [Myxococcales bacterium]
MPLFRHMTALDVRTLLALVCAMTTACGAAETSVCVDCGDDAPAPIVGRLEGDVALAVGPSDAVWFAGHDVDFGALVVGRLTIDAAGETQLIEPVRVDDGSPPSRRVGERPSLAVDSTGEPRVAYLDAEAGQAFLARRRGAWTVEPLDGPGLRSAEDTPGASVAGDDELSPFVTQVALALDAGGGEHVATLDSTTGTLRIISSTGACRNPAAAIPAAGTALLALEPRVVDAAVLEGAGVVPSRIGGVPSITVDVTGAIAVTFYLESTGDLALLTCAGESLTIRTIAGSDEERDLGDVGYWSSVAVDPRSGKLAIAFFDRTRGQLAYATSVKGEKAVVVIDDGAGELGAFSRYVGQMPSLSFAPLGSGAPGRPTVAYFDASEHVVRLATRDDFGRWSHEALADAEPLQGRLAAASVASGTWVAFARLGEPHVVMDTRDAE